MIFLKDEEFIRGSAPMTKEEVRILSIAKLGLSSDSRMLDIGAGTGSVAVQAALTCKEVVAVEKEEEAVAIIYENMKKFNINNMQVLKGEAFALVDSIEGEFDSIFIGGSGGNIEDIIAGYNNKLKAKGTMVLNFITVDNLYKAKEALKNLNYSFEVIQVAVSRGKGNSLMLYANNPIFIIKGTKL